MGVGGAASQGAWQWANGREWSSRREWAEGLAEPGAVPGAASLHTACHRHLELGVVRGFCTRCRSEVWGVATSHQDLWFEGPGAGPLHTAPCEQVKPD